MSVGNDDDDDVPVLWECLLSIDAAREECEVTQLYTGIRTEDSAM